jgi:hypothetical protein
LTAAADLAGARRVRGPPRLPGPPPEPRWPAAGLSSLTRATVVSARLPAPSAALARAGAD